MKALVLGGNRFFGKKLVALLLQRGVEVTILNRGQHKDSFGDNVHRIIMDRKQISPNHPAISGQKWDIIYDHICYDALEAQGACDSFKGKTNHYVFISSQSVYGRGSGLLESNFDPHTYQFASAIDRVLDYGEAKRQAECVFYRTNAFPVTAVRFPIVLGEDDYTERLKQHIDWIKAGNRIFLPNMDAKISFIHSSDAAGFLSSLLEHSAIGPINCCAAEPITLRDLISEIEHVVKKRALVTNRTEEAKTSPFGIESDWYMNTQKLHKSGFSPQPISTWLPDLIQVL